MTELPRAQSDGLRQPGTSTDESERIVWIPGDFDQRAWRRSAACREVETRVFFPVGATGPAVQQIAEAKAICGRCPVRLVCLQFALAFHHDDGVWGGYDEEERRDMRRRWRRLGSPLRIVPGEAVHRPGRLARTGPVDQPPEAS